MHNSVFLNGDSCGKLTNLFTGSVFTQLLCVNLRSLYATFTKVFPDFYSVIFLNTTLFFNVFTHFPQGLLLELQLKELRI